jgi:hypothetical protein
MFPLLAVLRAILLAMDLCGITFVPLIGEEGWNGK